MVFDETTVRALFSRTEVTFEPSAMSNKLKELMEKVAGLPSDNQKLVYKSFLKEKVLKVSIFMSVFNVHLNRAPVDGKVLQKVITPANFWLPVWKILSSQ
jgi:phosphatidylserine decarboxylase